jgi:SpoVK/Ycf46/Vps4 family AAA+-type ATPase
MRKFRKCLDAIFGKANKLSTILVFSKDVEAELRKFQKNLTQIDSNLGSVEVRFTEINVEIHIHAKTKDGLNALISSLDFFVSKCANKTSDGILIEKRERMKNLDFVDIGVGGLSTTLRTMIRRTFESRLIPNQLRIELGLSHVKGCLLYGPPGTGKTLIARKVAEILGCQEPKLVNGPEVESKWVGEAEKKIRLLFEDAEKEFLERGHKSQLHVIIFDEIDAIAKQRGGPHAKSRDGALNQLLCCLDGVNTVDNIVVFGLTNRKDCLDRALLRPGRLEVQLEIGAPDVAGRLEILRIHTKAMRESKRLSDDVDLEALAGFLNGFTGADIAGLVRSAVSFSLEEADEDALIDLKINAKHFDSAIEECRMTKEAVEVEDLDKNYDGLFHA